MVMWKNSTVAALAAAVLAAACGGGSGPAASSEPEATVAATSADTEEGADDVDALMVELAEMPYDERLTLIEQKAREEGAVLLYASANVEQQEGWAEGFQELYPDVNILYVRAKPGDLSERVQAEARAGRHLADVISVSAVSGSQLEDLGMFAEHAGAPVPEGFPERHVGRYTVTQYIKPNVIAWNTDLVSEEEAPRELDDLLDPKWKGKVAIDVGSQNFVAGLVADRGEAGARDYLTRLVVDNEALVRSGHSSMTSLMAAGEFPVAVELYVDHVEDSIQSDGAPLDWTAPDPTATSTTGVSIYKNSTRPHAGALLMHYLLSVDGSQITADTFGRLTTNPEVKLPYERLKAFTTEGEEANANMLPISPEVAREHYETAEQLLEEILIPRFSE